MTKLRRAVCVGIWLSSLSAGCGSRTEEIPGPPGVATCAFKRELASGTLCAIRPSAVSPGVSDDFGYHALGLPKGLSPTSPVYLHLVGSGGDPAKPESQNFPNETIMNEGMARGYLVILLAYDNEPAVGTLCKSDLPCYEAVRREILGGADAPAPYGGYKDVRPPNDVRSRLRGLILGLQKGEVKDLLPTPLRGADIDLGGVTLGGHSQGGGHVGLLAQDQAVQRLCFLSSPIDGAQQGGQAQAVPWVGKPFATPLGQRRAVIHREDDGFAKAQANFQAMGMVEGTHYRLLGFSTGDAHASTVKGTEDEAVAARAWACFTR